MNCVMVFSRRRCARGPMFNQAVWSLGTVVTDCHHLGAFYCGETTEAKGQRLSAPYWTWPKVLKLLAQLQRVKPVVEQETSSDFLRPTVAPLMCCDSWLTQG